MTLGDHLKRLRGPREAKEVYDSLSIKKSTFYHWEGPQSRPDPEDLKRLLDFYGASIADRLLAYELRGEPIADAA